MAFEHRRLGRYKARYNSDNDDNPIVYQLVVDGAKVTPTSATIAISDPDGTELVSATAMTKSTSLLTYTMDTTTTASWPVANSYRADIVVTYDSKTYDRHLVFDVVSYVFDPALGYDQLVSLDGNLRGMLNDGDDDLGNLIDAVRDIMQSDLEAKVVEDDKLLENMILDHTQAAVALRFRVLAQLYHNAGDEDRREYYEMNYWRQMRQMLATAKFDVNQDGQEDGELGGIQTLRLVY